MNNSIEATRMLEFRSKSVQTNKQAKFAGSYENSLNQTCLFSSFGISLRKDTINCTSKHEKLPE